jgi:predicted transcriptional regulator of viral defense system
MKTIDAYADLRQFGSPVLTTDDATTRLRVTRSAASRILARLAAAGLVHSLRRGIWSLVSDLDPLALSEYLTAPFPAYVSFQSALYLRGMISQIPQVVYVASLARTQRIVTSIGTYSIHHLAPEFFGGFRTDTDTSIHIASPEKALLDVLYLSNVRSRLFAALPEVEIPADFDEREARRWIGRIRSAYRRAMVSQRLEALLREHRR